MSRLASLARQAITALTPSTRTLLDLGNAMNVLMLVVAVGVGVPILTAMFLDRVVSLRQHTAVVATPDPQLAALQAEVEAIKARAELQEAQLLTLLTDAAVGCPPRP